MEWDGVIMDELGRFWLVDDEGEPYSGPYDTLEDAQLSEEEYGN